MTSKVFRLDRAEMRPSTYSDFESIFRSLFDEFTISGVVGSCGIAAYELERDFRGSGMTARSSKHKSTDPMARLQGIQGDMSVVTEAVKDAISSAT